MPDIAANTSVSKTGKLLGIEVIRFISAFSILVFHYQHFAYVGSYPNFVKEDQPFYEVLRLFYNRGYWGVQIFWCVSGFIFFWKYRAPIAGKLINGGKFFVLRISRLYPLHIATLLLVALLQLLYSVSHGCFFVYPKNDLLSFVTHLFMANGWGFQHGHSFNEPTWSISVEVLVYFLFFMLLRFVSKSALINLAIVFLCMAAKAARIVHPVVDCLVFFYVGGLAAIVRRAVVTRTRRLALSALGVCILCVGPPLAWSLHLQNYGHFPYLFLLVTIPISLFLLARDFLIKPRMQRVIEATGNMTYASYLLHFPIQLALVIGLSITGTGVPFYDPRFFLAYITITLVASYFVYRCFEAPAQDALRTRMLR